jgi:hypothetical protein
MRPPPNPTDVWYRQTTAELRDDALRVLPLGRFLEELGAGRVLG